MGFLGNLFGGNKQVKEMLDAGAIIIDVRTPQEFSGGHVKNSKNIPLDRISGEIANIKKLNKNIVLCCASGMRSASATSILKQAGINCCNGGSWRNIS